MFEDLDPFTATPAELLASVADMEPGPMAMSVLLMIDRAALSPQDAVTFVQIHERQASWWASVQVHAVVAAASGHAMVEELLVLAPGNGGETERRIRIADACRDELAAALRIAGSAAQDRIDIARLLAGPMGATGEALSLGEITPAHVRTIVDAAERLPGAVTVQRRDPREDGPAEVEERKAFEIACRALEDRVLPVARRSSRSLTQRAANRAVLAIDAQCAARRHREGRCTRDVFVVDEPDGFSVLMARLSSPVAHAVMAQVDTLARHPDLDVECGATLRERRAQALTALVLADGPARFVVGHDPAGSSDPGRADPGRVDPGRVDPGTVDPGSVPRPRLRAHVEVVIDLPTLLGLADNPADLAGMGTGSGAAVVGADVIRDLMADPDVAVTMSRLVTDPLTGHLLDVGRSRYEIPTALRRLVVARDRVCRFPGCRRAASRCQIDHAVAWDDGGSTDPANLGALCTRHHQLKTHGGWDIQERAADGSCTWTSPQGREYRHETEPALDRASGKSTPVDAPRVEVGTAPDPPPF